jgi:carboxypeptidase Q
VKTALLLLLSLILVTSCEKKQEIPENSHDKQMVNKIFDETMQNGEAYSKLRELCFDVGARISGSPELEKAVLWSKKVMEDYKFDNVFLQEVMVPHWVRGEKEIAEAISKKNGTLKLNILANGNSVGTTKNGLTAHVIQMNLPSDLETFGKEKIAGKIVFFNQAFDQRKIGSDYSGAGASRRSGAAEAEKFGAVGVIIRALSSAHEDDDFPHTGNGAASKIPTASMSLKSANALVSFLEKDQNAKIYMKMNCLHLPDKLSYNVVGEITGSEFPDKYIVVGGHLDSWDVGQGAHDDGTGCVQSIEVLRTFKALGIRPKHTLRAVMFTNEENGMRGGKKYAELAVKNKEIHVAAFESDGGGFTPRGFSVQAGSDTLSHLQTYLPNFDYRTITYIKAGFGGADIGPLNKALGTPAIGLNVDVQRYFDYHHTDADTFDKVNKRELLMGAASMASMIYLIDQNGLTPSKD